MIMQGFMSFQKYERTVWNDPDVILLNNQTSKVSVQNNLLSGKLEPCHCISLLCAGIIAVHALHWEQDHSNVHLTHVFYTIWSLSAVAHKNITSGRGGKHPSQHILSCTGNYSRFKWFTWKILFFSVDKQDEDYHTSSFMLRHESSYLFFRIMNIK